jgi:predicted nucleotidyltransferase
MDDTPSARYRAAAEEFATRVHNALGDEVDAIILYGSVARGEATEESDVDVMVLSPDPARIKPRVSRIRTELSCDLDILFLITLVHLSRKMVTGLLEEGSPFLKEVLTDGVALYDNGIFESLRRAAATARR